MPRRPLGKFGAKVGKPKTETVSKAKTVVKKVVKKDTFPEGWKLINDCKNERIPYRTYLNPATGEKREIKL